MILHESCDPRKQRRWETLITTIGVSCALEVMSLFGDYTDGVHVKISERYKPPPRIELSRGVADSDTRARGALATADYGFAFEGRVLAKLSELRAAKDTLASERRHRLCLREEAKQRRLDRLAAAADAAERLKLLSVSEVSYPSTDDMGVAPSPPNPPPLPPVPVAAPEPSILQPVQLSAHSSHYTPQLDLLTEPDPLNHLRVDSRNSRYSYATQNVDNLTFSDFENDTSSPFDNMELKSINDLDLLAQVLQNERASVGADRQSLYGAESDRASGTALPNLYPPASYSNGPIIGHSDPAYGSPQNYVPPGPYYTGSDKSTVGNAYAPSYDYDSTVWPPINGYYAPTATERAVPFLPQPYSYYNYPPVPSGYTLPYSAAAVSEDNGHACTVQQPGMWTESRCKSVPDIVKELSEEVATERLRADKQSSANPQRTEGTGSGRAEVRQGQEATCGGSRSSESLPDPLSSLSSDLQVMCRRISGMGFPLDRVARVCTLLGESDKKVVEGVLLVGQLMELGFSESRVAAVLTKHHFDRDKALEELIA